MIKLVLSDMDGTLLPHGQKRISARAKLAIHLLHQAGIAFGPSSGRERGAMFQPFWGDHRLYDTGILSNGKKVYLGGKLIDHRTLDQDGLQRLVGLVSDLPDALVNYYAPHGLRGIDRPSYVVVDCPQDEYQRIATAGRFTTRREFADHLPWHPKSEISCVCVCALGGQSRMDQLNGQLSQALPQFDFLQSSPIILDVAPHGVTKASALEVLRHALDIDLDEILYLGDSDNDVAMMRAIPNSVCMGDGTATARQAARWTIGRAADDAAAQVMEQLAAADGDLAGVSCLRETEG